MLMVTFKPIIIPGNRRKDGTYPVKIRVTHKGVSRRLPTTMVARPGDLTRSHKIKNPDILNRGAELISRMRAALVGVSPFDLEAWDVDKVVAHIRAELQKDSFRLDFFAFADGYLLGKSVTTRRAYITALNSLERFLGRRQLDVNEITKILLTEFREDIDGRGKVTFTGRKWKVTDKPQNGGQSTRILAKLAHIFKAAKAKYNDDDRVLIPRSPFDGLPKVVPPSKGQRNLGVDLMQKIIDAAAQTEGDEGVALCVFVVSFGLLGVNFADLWEAEDVGEVWIYNRAKTRERRADRAEMRVTIPPELSRFLGRLGSSGSGVWLPALRRFGKDRQVAGQKVNQWLKGWACREGLEDFTFYAARKTWGTLARNKAGVEKALVDECLCHVGDFPIADIYIERDWSLIDDANGKVLALFKWPGN